MQSRINRVGASIYEQEEEDLEANIELNQNITTDYSYIQQTSHNYRGNVDSLVVSSSVPVPLSTVFPTPREDFHYSEEVTRSTCCFPPGYFNRRGFCIGPRLQLLIFFISVAIFPLLLLHWNYYLRQAKTWFTWPGLLHHFTKKPSL